MAVNTIKTEFVEGRGGLLVPGDMSEGVVRQDFMDYLSRVFKANDLPEDKDIYLPATMQYSSEQLRPAALLSHVRDLLPADTRKQNRMQARRSGGQCDYYSVGTESFTINELPQHIGPVETGLQVSRPIRSIERVIGTPFKQQEHVTVQWNEANAYDIARERGDVTETSIKAVLSSLFSRMVTIFEA